MQRLSNKEIIWKELLKGKTLTFYEAIRGNYGGKVINYLNTEISKINAKKQLETGLKPIQATWVEYTNADGSKSQLCEYKLSQQFWDSLVK